MLPIPILDPAERVLLLGSECPAGIEEKLGVCLLDQQLFQLFRPHGKVLICILPPLESQRREQRFVFLVDIFPDADIAGGAEAAPNFDQHFLQTSSADDSTEEINHREVSVADTVQQNHISDQVRVGLLPERFPALAPDAGDDGGDIECLGIGIERIVQRVIADVAIERHLYIILFPATPL